MHRKAPTIEFSNLLVPTKSYQDQAFGTSGIRRSVQEFLQPHYVENLVTSIAQVCDLKGKSVVLGGDGRYFNAQAIEKSIKILIALGVKHIYVGQKGWFSTPAISYFIRKYKLDYGLIFSASHNPAGPGGDFGIKVNGANGSSILEALCQKIFRTTQNITEYPRAEVSSISLEQLTTQKYEGHGSTTILEVVDPVMDFCDFMEEIFDFSALRALFKSGFRMYYEGFNAITGIYAKEIFQNRLGVSSESLVGCTPLEDFAGNHADPNTKYAAHLIKMSAQRDAPDILFASDGDGDRNMVVGKDIGLVLPSDSLAIILHNHLCVPYYAQVKGVARSMATSCAVDLVAQRLNIPFYAVPTGWKFFGNLLEKGLISFCGEESYGTSSFHSGEKDGLWAMLFWLSIIAQRKMSVKAIVEDLWSCYGRCYYMRYDYLARTPEEFQSIKNKFLNLNNANINDSKICAAPFDYTDPVTGENSVNSAYVMTIGEGDRLILRSSGTDTKGVTIRLYLESLDTSEKSVKEAGKACAFEPMAHLEKFVKEHITAIIPSIIDK